MRKPSGFARAAWALFVAQRLDWLYRQTSARRRYRGGESDDGHDAHHTGKQHQRVAWDNRFSTSSSMVP